MSKPTAGSFRKLPPQTQDIVERFVKDLTTEGGTSFDSLGADERREILDEVAERLLSTGNSSVDKASDFLKKAITSLTDLDYRGATAEGPSVSLRDLDDDSRPTLPTRGKGKT